MMFSPGHEEEETEGEAGERIGDEEGAEVEEDRGRVGRGQAGGQRRPAAVWSGADRELHQGHSEKCGE